MYAVGPNETASPRRPRRAIPSMLIQLLVPGPRLRCRETSIDDAFACGRRANRDRPPVVRSVRNVISVAPVGLASPHPQPPLTIGLHRRRAKSRTARRSRRPYVIAQRDSASASRRRTGPPLTMPSRRWASSGRRRREAHPLSCEFHVSKRHHRTAVANRRKASPSC